MADCAVRVAARRGSWGDFVITSDDIASLVQRAETRLREEIGSRIRLSAPRVVSRRERSLVVRCDASGWGETTSIIIKRNLGDDQRGFTDWASLAFLSSFEDSRAFAPRFYAGDPDERFFIMEDLGLPLSLEDLFATGDTGAIGSALQRLGASMARMTASTAGMETHYKRMRATLPGFGNLDRRHEADRWLEAREKVVQWADLLGVQTPQGFDASSEHVAATYAEPGPWLAFSHGDPAPSNNHVAPERVCLIDYEYAGYRHALYDVTGWDSLCPLPPRLLAELEGAFRRTLGANPSTDAPVDDETYREAWETMCAYRTLAIISWMSPDLLEQDNIWVDNWTRRSALLSAVSRLSKVGSGESPLQPLAELGNRLFAGLHARWPELGDGAPNLIGDREDAP